MKATVGLLLITLVIACSSGSVGAAPNATRAAEPSLAWGPLAVIDPVPPVAIGEALATGTIRITEECVLLDDGGSEVLLVWMADRTTWDPVARTVTFANNDGPVGTVGDGDHVVLGGGGESAEEGKLRDIVWLSPPAPSCPGDERFTVGEVEADPKATQVNPDDGLTDAEVDRVHEAGWQAYQDRFAQWLVEFEADAVDLRRLPAAPIMVTLADGSPTLRSALQAADIVVLGEARSVSFRPDHTGLGRDRANARPQGSD